MKTVLLTGSNGQLGYELQRSLACLARVVAVDRRVIDLADPDTIRNTVREVRPDIIINAAAYTRVDQAETEPGLVMRSNGEAPGILAEEARRINATLIHYSSDYVFDGAGRSPYAEDATAQPLNVYGVSKLAGERAIQATGGSWLILRTSWVYGARGRNFLTGIRSLLGTRSEVRVVNDQQGAPTWSRMIAEVTALILARCGAACGTIALDGRAGIYHLSAAGQTCWHGFAQRLLDHHLQVHPSTGMSRPRLIPVSSAQYGSPTPRPAYSVLSNVKLQAAFGIALPDWESSLQLCLQDLSHD